MIDSSCFPVAVSGFAIGAGGLAIVTVTVAVATVPFTSDTE